MLGALFFKPGQQYIVLSALCAQQGNDRTVGREVETLVFAQEITSTVFARTNESGTAEVRRYKQSLHATAAVCWNPGAKAGH